MSVKNYTWDLSPLLASDDDPKVEKELKEIESANLKFVKKWQDRTDYLKDPKILKKALDEYEELQSNFGLSGDTGYYFELRSSIDENDPKLKAKSNQIDEFARKLLNEIQFFELKIAKIPESLQKKFLSSKELTPYKHFLEQLFRQSKYLLSEPEEKIMNLKSQTSYGNWVKMTSSFLSQEEREALTEDNKKAKLSYPALMGLMNSQKKKVRDQAAKAFNDILDKWKDVATEELNSILGNKKVDDELRGFSRPDESRLLNDDFDTEITDTVLEAVSSRYKVAQRYYILKADLLGVKKLEYHERNIEYGSIDKDYNFVEASKLVQKVFGNLDQDFLGIFNSFLENRQFDVFPKKGKRGGAYCAHNLKRQPTYIFLNHNGKLNDVLTLAHETGHGINNELMRKKQNALNFHTPTSTAEIASTFMEDFVLEEILKEADDELRLSLMVAKLNQDVSAIFRQVALYKFEQELHQTFRERGYLSTTEIGEIFQKHMLSYMGSSVEPSPGSENWWVYWNHIRYFFYVYSYASGLLISKSMQNSVKENHEFIEKVKYFLSAGSSESPKQIFKNIGIDLTQKEFWEKGLDEVENLLKETEKLAKKLHKI